jgi:hypothetical protein
MGIALYRTLSFQVRHSQAEPGNEVVEVVEVVEVEKRDFNWSLVTDYWSL